MNPRHSGFARIDTMLAAAALLAVIALLVARVSVPSISPPVASAAATAPSPPSRGSQLPCEDWEACGPPFPRTGIRTSHGTVTLADLKAGMVLRGADLSGVNWHHLKLPKVRFVRCSLQRAYLRGTDFRGARFVACNLRGAILEECLLDDADLSGCDLRGASLAHLDIHPISRVCLRAADLRGADLHDSNFLRADFRWADLRGADCIALHLDRCDLRGADLRGVEIGRADVRNCDLRRVNLRRAFFWETALDRTDLRGADLRDGTMLGCDLSDSRLDGAPMKGVRYGVSWYEPTSWPTGFDPLSRGARLYRPTDADDAAPGVPHSSASGPTRDSAAP